MKKHNNCFPRHYIKNINKLSFKTSGRRYKFFELDGEYQLVRLNDYSHLRELQTVGYEKWGLFAARDYWAKQPNF